MYDFLIGGKTGASRSLAVCLFDRDSLCGSLASLAQDHHLIDVTTSNCTQNERISHGYRSNAKSL
jgi:hypothetical protein